MHYEFIRRAGRQSAQQVLFPGEGVRLRVRLQDTRVHHRRELPEWRRDWRVREPVRHNQPVLPMLRIQRVREPVHHKLPVLHSQAPEPTWRDPQPSIRGWM